jgi:hypothetical protein
MKTLRYLLAIGLFCGLSGIAKADDFQMVVIDPIGGSVITTTAFPFSFSPCAAGEVPSNPNNPNTYIGCFVGENGTGVDLTSLQLLIPPIPNQSAGCSPFGEQLDIFTSITCTSGPNGYLVNFAGGDIPLGGFFLIAEAGVDPTVFPQVAAVANAPEPGSLLLLSTGVLAIGFFFTRRRNAVGDAIL